MVVVAAMIKAFKRCFAKYVYSLWGMVLTVASQYHRELLITYIPLSVCGTCGSPAAPGSCVFNYRGLPIG